MNETQIFPFQDHQAQKKIFEDLIENTKAKYILISYNNAGIISEKEMENILSKKGSFTIVSKQLEGITTRANHQILYQLSTESNALMFTEFNTQNIVNKLTESPLNKIVLHSSHYRQTTSAHFSF